MLLFIKMILVYYPFYTNAPVRKKEKVRLKGSMKELIDNSTRHTFIKKYALACVLSKKKSLNQDIPHSHIK